MHNAETKSDVSLEMFSGKPQHDAFARMKEVFPTRVLLPSDKPYQFADGVPMDLPETYVSEGQVRSIEGFFTATDTSAILVLKDGAVRFERYALNGGRDVQWMSWSVAKSFVSALVGIAIEEGHIQSIEEPISRYISVSVGSAYDGVSIKDVLQMSSGASWSEDYSDPDAEIHKFGAAMSEDGSLDVFLASMTRDKEPGTNCRYNSAETQALGALLVQATGRSITDYMQEKLYEPLGMESSGHWLLDGAGMEMAFAGLNLTARDFAKIGELYRNKGVWDGKQIVPRDWVSASITPDAPHLMPGKVQVGTHVFAQGYGYQWWIPEGDCGEFTAIGVYNQFVYVDPSRDVVIVKLSANRTYGTLDEESTNRETETVEFLRAIAKQLD